MTGDLDAAHATPARRLPARRRFHPGRRWCSIRCDAPARVRPLSCCRRESEHEIRAAQAALAPFPALVHGFLADAEKEFVEARLVLAFVRDGSCPAQTSSPSGPWRG
ncbi:MAG: hypothetical protein R2699_08610 [Acidimicrobiales bacterium]